MEENIDFNALTTKEVESIFSEGCTVRPNKMYDGGSFFVTIRLSDFFDARILEEESLQDGSPERGIFIPIRNNGLLVTKNKNVLTTFKMEVAQVQSPKYTHIVTQVVDPDVVKERKKLGFKMPLMGFARPINWKKKKR